MMDRAREKFLAGPRFAEQQNSGFRLRDALSFADSALERLRFAEYAWETVTTRPLFTQQHVFGSESRLFERTLDEQEEVIRIDRFLKEVLGAVFHCLHGFVYRAESRHHDYGHVGVGSTSGAKHIEARAVWHTEIGEHKTMTRICNFVEGLASVDRFSNGVSGILEGQSQYATEAVFIFNE
jgi:hypothetical protein